MNERLIKLMEYLEYTPSVFADEIGVIRSSISHIMSGRNKPGVELLQRVLKRFPEVSAEWLLAGIGPMFKDGTRTIVNPAPKHEPVQEIPKSAEQTSLLGYLESIQQPAQAQTAPYSVPEEAFDRSIAAQADKAVEPAQPIHNGVNQPKTESIPKMEEQEKPEMPVEVPAIVQALKKEKSISRIVVYYNDKTYQEFRMSED